MIFGSPQIVTDSLVLYVDAANPSSYTSGSITWKDLSGNNRNGTLSGSVLPTYFPNNGGNIKINGTGSNVDFGPILNFTTESFSFNFWSYFTTLSGSLAGQNSPFFWKGYFNSNGYYFSTQIGGLLVYNSYQNAASQQTNTGGGAIRTGSWYNISLTCSGSSVRIYVNGVDKTITSGSHIANTSSPYSFLLGQYAPTTPFNSSGSFGMLAAYSKQLSPTEVFQNL